MTTLASEKIIINPLSVLLPGQTFATEKNLTSLTLSLTPTGGSFSMTLLRNLVKTPTENLVITLPFGRFGTVKGTGSGFSSGGIVDTISGPALPFVATQQTYLGIPGNVLKDAISIATTLAQGATVIWATLNPLVKNFIFRGIMLSGIQQLASLLLAEIFIRDNAIYVVDPGQTIGNTPFQVNKSDIVSATQAVDYSLDIPSVLNPALLLTSGGLPGEFVYDSDHAQKQPKFTVQCGAPGSEASSDFIPIPDGWLIDGNFEEWTPPSGTDFTNPSSSVTNGRYWKVFQSPTNPNLLRGITSFTRLVKQLNLPGNVSPFVGSPITSNTRQNTTKELYFSLAGIQNGIQGFQSTSVSFFDVVSNRFYTFPSALVLIPNGLAVSGEAASNFFSITMEQWTFPLVNPQGFPVGLGPDPTNPFNIPPHVQVVNPSSNVVALSVQGFKDYYNRYLQNFRKINSPRLRTSISVVYRNYLPQSGDQLIVNTGLPVNDCGRISSVTLNFGRGGLVLNIVAEVYNYHAPGGVIPVEN
jgi:hypothetical protein